MDRSRQGVAPRSCLSKLPLKPRANGPSLPQHQQSQYQNNAGPNYRNGPQAMHTSQRNNFDLNMFPAPLSPSMPNMNGAHGTDMYARDGRPRAHSQSRSLDMRQQQRYQHQQRGQSQSPQMLPSAGFGISPPRQMSDHRRSASMSQLINNSNNVGALGMGRRGDVPGQAM